MKYYPDGNLADLLRHQTLTSAQICDITRGILLGLQHLHRNRIVHRDFKPANILISRDNAGRFIPKIADFGLSKLVNADELDSSDFDLSDGRGTPSYKAPEQIEGSRVSFNLDLWAFGVILYEMLTGEKPFRSDSRNTSEQSVRREIEKKIMSVELPARTGQIAEPYQAMIRRCLVRDIHERVRREDELLNLLDGITPLLVEANQKADAGQYERAIQLYEQVLAKRDHHAGAEQALDRCRALLNAERVEACLRKADTYTAKQQYEEAKANYAQVLQLEPTHLAAAQGLALCIEQLRPMPSVQSEPVAEGTDLYEERTDVYQSVAPAKAERESAVVPVSEPVVAKLAAAVTNVVSTTGAPVAHPLPAENPVITQSAASPPKRVIPWKMLVPVAVGLGGLGLGYNVFYSVKTTQPSVINSVTDPVRADLSNAGAVLPDEPRPAGSISGETATSVSDPAFPLPTNKDKAVNPAAIAKRIDVALDKARRAYEQKDYQSAEMYTRSALQLDPTRRDVEEFHNSALNAVRKQVSTTPPETATVTTEVKPELVDDKEKLVNAKQKFQNEYDQLIDEGVKAIAGGNNKVKAIADFTRAHALAKEHSLNMDKADGPYAKYLDIANRRFESDDYEMAKSWYGVAQALKNTADVQRKIKQCTNQ